MDKERLLKIIQSGESQEVEIKQSFHSSQDYSKIMCGLANTFGGIIIIGVNSKKEVVGLKEDIDSLQQRVSAVAQAVSPPIFPVIEVHEFDGKKILLAIIQKAIDNTFHTFHGVIWVKIGSTLKRIEGNQMLEFLRVKQVLCFDETPSSAKINDLDKERIEDYLELRKQTDFLKNHSTEDFLLNMRLATKNGDLRIKNSALLFFAKEPTFFNPQIELKLARFEGVEPVKIIAHELIQSDLIQAIERSLSFVKENISKSIEITDKAKREERYQYPIKVIREAIVNSIAHRDYFSKDSIQIYLFGDRIEITNPGSLPAGLPKELFGTLSVQRNPITYRILRDYGYVEGLGSGIPRMINGMREYGLADPEFGIYENFFRVILRNTKSDLKPIKNHKDLNERQIKALEFLKRNKSIKTQMYIKLNKVSMGTARLDINELVNFGYLKKVGSFRGAYYILNKESK